MQLTLTIKYRLYIQSSKVAQAFGGLSERYSQACSYASREFYKVLNTTGTRLSQTKLHKRVYYPIRRIFGLKAQEADSVPRTVIARYKSVATQLFNQTRRYKDKYSKDTFYINKTIADLWNPIHFRRPQADLVHKNDYSFVHKNGTRVLSINTLKKRVKVSYYLPKYFRKYFAYPYKLGTAKLLHYEGHWYLNISITINVKLGNIKHLVGNDRGIRFLYYGYDDNKHSCSQHGLKLRKKRSHFLRQRAQLQHTGTRSAKRKLKHVSGRENCWMNCMNHTASKALVRQYPKGTAYILENLRGVKFEAMNASRRDRYSRATWSFYGFGTKLSYKANLKLSRVVHINPQYTSQRCPRCGHVMKDSRNHDKHIFICEHCGYTSNDDRIGGMNIYFLGKLQYLGYTRPFIKKDNQIGYHTKVRVKLHHKNKYIHKIKYLSREKALQLMSY